MKDKEKAETYSERVVKFRKQIVEFMEENDEVFEQFYDLIDQYNDAIGRTRNLLRTMEIDRFTGKTFGEFRVTARTDKGYNPEDVREIDPDALALPGVVKQVNTAVLTQAIRAGQASHDLEKAFYKREVGRAVYGPKEIEIKLQ
jgi:hypothetical protein